jgi:hypothetical protein
LVYYFRFEKLLLKAQKKKGELKLINKFTFHYCSSTEEKEEEEEKKHFKLENIRI